MYFTVSICKDGAGYNFENGTRASVGSNGLGYTFNNGAQVYGKPIAGGKLQQVKSDARKPGFGGLRTIKVQTSMCVRATIHHLCYSLSGNYHI